MTTETKPNYPVNQEFFDWLQAEHGRAAHFWKADSGLFPTIISKFKHGTIPITFEYAVRMERAQKPSDAPLDAERLCTFAEDKDLVRYLRGQAAAHAEGLRKAA